MAKKNYYAWIAPDGAGIFRTWKECQAACSGHKMENHKGFATYEEAWHFAYPHKPYPGDPEPPCTETTPDETDVPTDRVDGEISSAPVGTPFLNIDIPVSEEVVRFCAKYGFEKLSDRQRMAVQSVEGKTLLFAVPGCGKTTVIIARTGFMVYSRNIDPNTIISLTFTKAAANEMVTRYKDHFETENVPDFRTIHSFCYSIILPRLCAVGYGFPSHLLGTEEGAEEEEKPRTPAAVYKSLFAKLQMQPSDFESAMEAVQCVITGIKNSVMQPVEYENRIIKIDRVEYNVGKLFKAYQEILKELDCMDFDDLLIHAYKGLKSYPQVRERLRKKYQYWNVDEAQDTSKLQFMLLDYLCGADGNVFMVGDDDQSIYSFRGANPRLLLDFGHRGGVTTLLMGYNYRSDRDIVSAAKSFIETNKNRAQKEMQASSSRPGYIHIPQAFRTEVGQYDFIVQAAKEAVSRNETLAVLYRRNISCLPLIVYLHRYGIPYEANKGIAELLRTKDIKKMWKVFLFLISPTSFTAFSACQSTLGLYLDKAELADLKETHERNSKAPILELLLQKYEENNDSDTEKLKSIIGCFSRISKMQPSAAVKAVFSDLLIWSPDSISDRLRVYSFLSVCDLYKSIPELIKDIRAIISEEKKKATAPDPTDFDNSLSAVTTVQKPLVTLSSMHASKGREFSRVVIVDSFDEIMPGQQRDDALIYDPEEEARLFYVAVTRAAHRLDLLTVDKYHGNPEKISRFIGAFAYLCDQNCVNASILETLTVSDRTKSEPVVFEPKKFYAVKNGRKPGIYTSWGDCQSQVRGYSGAVYKSFPSLYEAEEYLGIAEDVPVPAPSLSTIEPCIVSSDGALFNYPIDLPPIVCESVYKHFGVLALDQISTETLAQLKTQINYFFYPGQKVDYCESADAYLLTYMPVNYYKIWKPLYDLGNAGQLSDSCRVLELGAGPGTATMGLISFYSGMAVSNPDRQFVLDITAIEKESSFKPLFDMLTGQLITKCPSNLKVSCRLNIGDAFGDLSAYGRKYDLIIESNMLNLSEGVGEQSIDLVAHILSKTLDENGYVVMIEPGTKKDKEFLERIESMSSNEQIAVPFVRSTIKATDVSEITLYKETISVGLRGAKKDVHWFSYLVLKKGFELI